jgi:cysteine desulfurase/selenocysteine lyase
MLAAACTARTRAVTVSLVQFSNGYRIDAAALGRFCRERGIYFHVDAIQALGALRCNVGSMKIDFLSTGGHKWLMGPAGIGFLYCRRELIEELDIWNPGWLGVEDAWDFMNYRQAYRAEALRFEEGTRNLYGIAGLGASIERFLEIGMTGVERRILALTGYLEKGLRERGCRISSPRRRGERSGILCFVHPRIESARLFEKLMSKRVVVSLRQGALRLSPHFYNTEAEADRLLDLI